MSVCSFVSRRSRAGPRFTHTFTPFPACVRTFRAAPNNSFKPKLLRSGLSAALGGRANLGVERAKVLGSALHCHPAVLVFPGWQLESAA
jgi:hypothetical protein